MKRRRLERKKQPTRQKSVIHHFSRCIVPFVIIFILYVYFIYSESSYITTIELVSNIQYHYHGSISHNNVLQQQQQTNNNNNDSQNINTNNNKQNLQGNSKLEEIFDRITLQEIIQSWKESTPNQDKGNLRNNMHPNSHQEYKVKWPQTSNQIQNAIMNDGHVIDVDQSPTGRKKKKYIYDCKQRPFVKYQQYIQQQQQQQQQTQEGKALPNDMKIKTCQSPPKKLATIVTAFYEMNSKHSTVDFVEWFPYMLSASDPMVIFIPSKVSKLGFRWVDFVKEYRQHAPTIVVPFPFQNLTMGTTFTDSFWNVTKKKDFTLRKEKGVDIYKIWNEKMILLHNVAQLNPFDTYEFFWIDAGYFRNKYVARNGRALVTNNITANGVPTNSILFPRIKRNVIAAGAWGGTAQGIDRMYDKYFETFWFHATHQEMIKDEQSCICTEQNIFLHMCRNFPDICWLLADPKWFAMGRRYLSLSDYSFANKNSPVGILDLNISMPVVPIPYPNSSTVIDEDYLLALHKQNEKEGIDLLQ